MTDPHPLTRCWRRVRLFSAHWCHVHPVLFTTLLRPLPNERFTDSDEKLDQAIDKNMILVSKGRQLG